MKITRINQKNWYSGHISFEMPILRTYVEGVERQIQESKKDYEARAEVVEEIEIPEENIYQVVTVIDGLDDTMYSFNAVFEEYFPQLQRRSALITLYSFFEFEFLALCKMWDAAFEPRKYNAAKGSYLAKCFHLLTTTGGLKISLAEPAWLEIDDGVRAVRNCIVHNDSKLPNEETDDRKKVDNHLRDYPGLVRLKGESINLENAYLEHVLEVFDQLCKVVDWSINPR